MAKKAMQKKHSASGSLKRYHHGHVRADALKVALCLIEKNGISGLSLREVATQLKISHVSLYHHFADKDDLINALAAEGFELFNKIFDGCQHSEKANWENHFQQLAIRYVSFATLYSSQYEIMYSKYRSVASVSADVKLHGDKSAQLLLEFVDRGLKLRIIKGDRNFISAAIWSSLHGISDLIKADRLHFFVSKSELEKFVKNICVALVTGFK